MNIVEMQKIVEAGQELLRYCRDYYSLEHDGIYGERYQFTDEEIVEAINIYFADDAAWQEINKYGADTVDRETICGIVMRDIRNENVYI